MSLMQDPGYGVYAVTPSDSDPQPGRVRALYVGGAGDLVVTTRGNDTPTTFKSVPAGFLLSSLQIVKVMATDTTATDIVAFT